MSNLFNPIVNQRVTFLGHLLTTGSKLKVLHTGPGSAMPVVSIKMPSKACNVGNVGNVGNVDVYGL